MHTSLNITEITPALGTAVTSEALRLFLRLDDMEPVDFLNDCLAAAEDFIQRKAGLSLLQRRLKVAVTNFNGDGFILPHPPVLSVISVNVNGEAQTADTYKFLGSQLYLPNGACGDLEVIYDAGYATTADCPPGLKRAILHVAGLFYEDRPPEAIERDKTALALLKPFMRLKI